LKRYRGELPKLFIYVSIYGLFSNAVRSSGCVVSHGIIRGELEMMCEEAVMAYFRALSLHLPEENKNIHEKPQSR
jgi:hypothetical protein